MLKNSKFNGNLGARNMHFKSKISFSILKIGTVLVSKMQSYFGGGLIWVPKSITMETRYNEQKQMKNNLDITKARYCEQILPVSCPFVTSGFHCT